jgi:hypothetical protein
MKTAVLFGALLSVLSGVAQTTVIYQTGFEAPIFHTGQLSGQSGWSGTTVGTVESGITYSGTQAVEFNPVGTSLQNHSSIATAYKPLAGTGENAVVLQVAAMFSSSGTQSA